ncbi:MAG: FadR family transcriptional regulator [Deltaproteobacteria bacterium]|nr:FadR family transcriptional regulator [Deltaproteobacteria bacterium]
MTLPIEPRRAVDLTAEVLRARILNGEYPIGSRLPPERALAEALGINRLTLRAALARLEAESLVRPRQGDGVRVLDFRATAGFELVRHLVGAGDVALMRAFLELRRAVAVEAVALATERASPAAIDALEAMAIAQAEEEDDEAFTARDLAFGRAMLRLAENLPMELLLNSVERVYLARPDLSAALHGDRARVRASYALVVGLLRAGDSAAARETVRAALEAIDQQALAALGPKKASPSARKNVKKRGPKS